MYQKNMGVVRFALRIQDDNKPKEFKEIKIFEMNFARVTSAWQFSARNKSALTIPKTQFGTLKNASIQFYQDKTDTNNVREGFYLVNMQQIAYFSYKLNTAGDNYNLKKHDKVSRSLVCLPEGTNVVSSVYPIASLGYNALPAATILFIKYRAGDSNKKVSGYANYNLLTNRYSCKTDKKSELENMVSDQKLITF
jgi:hypothetical protein